VDLPYVGLDRQVVDPKPTSQMAEVEELGGGERWRMLA
jgi:hypothetical protein